jgi:hypothetical protein
MLALVGGGWWWIRNLVVYGAVIVGIPLLPDAPDAFAPDPLWWLRRFAAWITESYWGWFGWFDVRIPLWTVAVAMALVVGGVSLAFLSRRGSGKTALLFLLTFPTLAIGGLVMAFAYRDYLKTGLTPAIQGRYLFPGVAGLATVTMVGLQRLFRRGANLVLLAAGFVAVMQTIGVVTALHFYWAPRAAGPLWEEARSMVAWSPWPGESVVVLAVISVVFGVWLIHDIVRPILDESGHRTSGAVVFDETADA